MADRTLLEYGVYVGDQDGQSRFRLCQYDKIVVYDKSVAGKIKVGCKVVLNTQDRRVVMRVHDPESVIHGNGTISTINCDFGYITSKSPAPNQSIIFFARNFDHPKNRSDNPMNTLLPVGALVRYEAVPQENQKAKFRAVRVIWLEENPTKASGVSFPKVLSGKQGIVLGIIFDKSLYLWSKELGKVYAPKSLLVGSRNHQFQVGQWLEFDVHQQEQKDRCSWVAFKSRRIMDQLKFTTVKTLHRTNLEVVDCIGMVTNVFGNNAMLWSPQLGKVLLSKTTTKGWNQQLLRRRGYVKFIAEEIIKPDYEDIGWRAKSIESAPSTGLRSISFERCTAQLIDIPKPCCGMLYNEQFGKIAFTWMDFYPFVSTDTQFRTAVNKLNFDVRFVKSLEHWNVKWCAVYVQAGQEAESQPLKVEEVHAASNSPIDNSFLEELDNELEQMQWNQNTKQIAANTAINTQLEPLDEPMKDASCQTEPLLEFSLFRLVRDTPALLTLMKERHRDQILIMTQLLSHRFKPNYLSAKAESDSIGLQCKNVSCQTASMPGQALAHGLIGDEQMFDLLMDIDPALLLALA